PRRGSARRGGREGRPRHAAPARFSHAGGRPPILELIHPMTTSARELDRVREYYERFVAGMEQVTLGADERPLGAWFGRFSPSTVRMIPLIEDRDHLLAADDLVRDYLRGKELDHMRVFIARSDPALNYGYLSAVLLALVALERLAALEGETGVAIHPVIGVGSVPFRGGPAPRHVARAVPRRRLRKMHVGLFGYNRESAGVSLPRAIPFCASLYSLGLPPELIGLAAVTDADWSWLRATVPSIEADLADAVHYLDRDALAGLPPRVRQ